MRSTAKVWFLRILLKNSSQSLGENFCASDLAAAFTGGRGIRG